MNEVSMSPLNGTIVNMSELDIQHKTDFEKFIRAERNGSFRAFMVELFDKWHTYNRDYFTEALVIPTYILLGTPTKPSVLGQYATVSSFGGTSEIRIRPTLFTGKHPLINAGAPMEGRKRFLFDVLLHEMVHQYQMEILNHSEDSFHAHGPIFRDECNRISDILGIAQRVRTCKKRGKGKDLPSCSHWPHNVRPDDYYMGAWIDRVDQQKPDPEPDPPEPTEKKWTLDEIKELIERDLSEGDQYRLGSFIISNGRGFNILIETMKTPDVWIDAAAEAFTAEESVVVANEFNLAASWMLEMKYQELYGDDYQDKFEDELDRLINLSHEEFKKEQNLETTK